MGEHLAQHFDAGQMLTKPVVQILADATLFAFADFQVFLFQPFALRDVADETGEDFSIAQLDFTDRQIDGKQGAVFFAGKSFAPDPDNLGVAGPLVVANITVVLLTVRGGHQQVDVLADDFTGLIAKDFFGSGIERLNGPVFVNGDNSLDGGL